MFLFFKEIILGIGTFAKGIVVGLSSVTPVGLATTLAVTVGTQVIGRAIAKKIVK